MADARTEGTFGQNAELAAAGWADSLIDAPVWLFNKATGSDVPAPLHLSADVYGVQTDGLFRDPNTGEALTAEQIAALAANGEDTGAIYDAAVATADKIAHDPLSIIPGWALALAAVLIVIVGLYYGTLIYKAAT